MVALIQWPAMVVTLLASWLVAPEVPIHAYGLIVLQVALAAMNIRGVSHNE